MADDMVRPKSELMSKIRQAGELSGVVLVKSNFELDDTIFRSPSEDNEMDIESITEKAEVAFNSDRTKARVQFDMQGNGLLGGKVFFKLSARYFAFFSFLKPDLIEEDEAVEAMQYFCVHTGMFATYPYFRELFSSYSYRSEVSLPTLPVLKFEDVSFAQMSEVESSSSSG